MWCVGASIFMALGERLGSLTMTSGSGPLFFWFLEDRSMWAGLVSNLGRNSNAAVQVLSSPCEVPLPLWASVFLIHKIEQLAGSWERKQGHISVTLFTSREASSPELALP